MHSSDDQQQTMTRMKKIPGYSLSTDHRNKEEEHKLLTNQLLKPADR